MTTRTQTDKSLGTPATTTDAGRSEPTGVKDAAAGVADEAGRTIEQRAAVGMSQVGDTLHQVARAVRDSSDSLQAEQPQVGRLVSTAADKLDEFATYVEDREPREILDNTQSFARRQPAVVIAGGLAAGLLIGRLLRSAGSQSGQQGSTANDWYGAGYQNPDEASSYRRSGTTGVSSGYGTGYGATHDRGSGDVSRPSGTSSSLGSRQGQGNGSTAGTPSGQSQSSGPDEG
jgi:hypothetical protein